MSPWEKFDADVVKCTKKRIRKDIGPPDPERVLTSEEVVHIFRLSRQCYLEKMKKVGVRRFDRMVEELVDEMNTMFKVVNDTLFEYMSGFGNVRALQKQEELGKDINEAIVEETFQAIDPDDPRLTERMWLLEFLRGRYMNAVLVSLQPLWDILGLSQSILNLDLNWAVSTLALVAEEGMVREKLREFGIPPGDRRNFHNLLEKLMEEMERQGIRPTHEVLLSDGYRNIRNNVAHDPVKWHPTKKEMHDVSRHAIQLAQALWPDKFDATD